MFTGFLEGGKTRFMQETLEDERFNSGERTLLLQCEEGIEELDPSRFPGGGKNILIQEIDSPEQINAAYLNDLAKKAKAERVLIEYNGMWNLNDLAQAMPENWIVYQEFMFADARCFLSYNANMRSLMVDKLMTAELIVLNRATPDLDKMEIHKVIRGVSRRVNIAYEYPDGRVEYDEIEDPLPFDVNADPIVIEDSDYALWYRDMSEEMEKYSGKTVRFKALIAKNAKMPDNMFVAGRHVMTCCVQDIQYSGLVCKWLDANKLKNRTWGTVTAKIELVMNANKCGTPIICSMGTGNKLNPAELEVADIYKTSVCPLARIMRYELKRRGIKKLKVVYSKEMPIVPTGAAAEKCRAESTGKKNVPGSTAFVPAVAGMIIASEIVKDICSVG